MNIDLNAVVDFPQGRANHGGWYCRACGDEILVDSKVYRPKDVWVCEACYRSGKHASTPQGRRAAQQQRQQPQNSASTSSAWDAFHSRAAQPPPKQPAPAVSDDGVESVTEENWIEVIFELIPDLHLKRVYAALSRTYHPDTGGSVEEQTRINVAFAARKKENG